MVELTYKVVQLPAQIQSDEQGEFAGRSYESLSAPGKTVQKTMIRAQPGQSHPQASWNYWRFRGQKAEDLWNGSSPMHASLASVQSYMSV